MPRPVLLAALLAGAIGAQGPSLVVYLRDPSGQPVVGAHGAAFGPTAPSLPALGELPPWHRSGNGARDGRLLGTSDEHSLLRFDAERPDATPGAVSGHVWTEAGLGALVVDLYAGRAQRLSLQPMAELTTADGETVLTVRARAHLSGGRTVVLQVADGTSVRLPAGDYELWIGSGERWTWQRHRLRSGQRTVVGFDGPVRRLTTDAATDLVMPAGRPDVRLAGANSSCTLCGAATQAPLLALRAGVVHGPAVPGATTDAAATPWPPAADHATRRVDLDLASESGHEVQVYGVQRVGPETWRLLGAATPAGADRASQRPEPFVTLPAPPDGDNWLLCVADGYAPQAQPWPAAAARPAFALERGVPLAIACRDEQGLPVVDVAVDYEPDGMPAATVAAHSDAFGIARLGAVLGPGRVRVLDPRFANQSLELATIPVEPLLLTITPGEMLHGVAVWPDGSPAAGVVVTLRDPTGALRPAERAVVSGADGSFAFGGLGPNRGLVLFASTQRDGHTWSGKLDRLLPGGGTIQLVVRDEDPQLLPR